MGPGATSDSRRTGRVLNDLVPGTLHKRHLTNNVTLVLTNVVRVGGTDGGHLETIRTAMPKVAAKEP